jgi:hypothetical protein
MKLDAAGDCGACFFGLSEALSDISIPGKALF